MFKSLSRSIEGMPLHYCDLYAIPKYRHKRKWATVTWRRIIEIVYVLDCISSPVFKQMIHLISIYNPLFIYKMQFLLLKTVWSAFRCNWNVSKIIMITSYWHMHCDHIFANNLTSRKYTQKNMHFSQVNFPNSKDISYRHHMSWKPIFERMPLKLRK